MDETGKESLSGGTIPTDRIISAACTLVDFKLARRAFIDLPDDQVPVMSKAVFALASLNAGKLDDLSPADKNLAVNLARSELNRLNGHI